MSGAKKLKKKIRNKRIPRWKITSGGHGNNTKITFDGQTVDCTNLKFEISANGAPANVTLQLLGQDVDVHLTGLVEKKP